MWNSRDRPHANIPGAKDAPIASETRQLSLLEDFEKAFKRKAGATGSPLEAEVTPDDPITQNDADARASLNKAEVEQEPALASNKYLLSVPCELITPMMSTPGKLHILKRSLQVAGGQN